MNSRVTPTEPSVYVCNIVAYTLAYTLSSDTDASDAEFIAKTDVLVPAVVFEEVDNKSAKRGQMSQSAAACDVLRDQMDSSEASKKIGADLA